MIPAWDKLAAVGLAIGLHVVVVGELTEDGADTGGVGGDSSVSIRASAAQVETMVAEWTRPPETQLSTAAPEDRSAAQVTPPPEIRELTRPEAPRAVARLTAMDPKRRAQSLPVPPKAPAPLQAEVQAAPGLVAPPETPRPSPMQRPQVDTAARAPLQPPAPPPPAVADAPPPRAETPPPPIPKVKPKARPERPAPKAAAQPARKTRAATAGQAARKAAGAGGSEQAGAGGTPADPVATKGQRQRALSAWGAKIAQRIARRARASGRSGEVRIAMAVARNGRVLQVRLTRSSGDAALDRDALRAVRSAGRMPPAPEALTEPSYSFSFPLVLTR